MSCPQGGGASAEGCSNKRLPQASGIGMDTRNLVAGSDVLEFTEDEKRVLCTVTGQEIVPDCFEILKYLGSKRVQRLLKEGPFNIEVRPSTRLHRFLILYIQYEIAKRTFQHPSNACKPCFHYLSRVSCFVFCPFFSFRAVAVLWLVLPSCPSASGFRVEPLVSGLVRNMQTGSNYDVTQAEPLHLSCITL